jgi:hypothetical protein
MLTGLERSQSEEEFIICDPADFAVITSVSQLQVRDCTSRLAISLLNPILAVHETSSAT